ncbi:MAG: NADP-dependent isocitrate dehydrogenase [Proteobacteria bacterium]|nr:NADP-dependent isocitrate dehydrogenase [Pseudomonadota bacterium]
MTHHITLIQGDGIGPEVVGATKAIIDASGVKIDWEVCEAGKEVFKKGIASGVPQETIDSIKRTRLVLKGPLETPVGFGEKSANVTLRKLFETYANIRPIKEFPGVDGPYKGKGIDFVIIRENVEDLYAGIEYMSTPGVAKCLKLITRKGCEKIVRLAFEFVRAEGRKTLHCATKANIMKFSEGMLKKTFEEIAPEYPDIEAHHIIVDNCAHQLVRFPDKFEAIVTTNMNGDILSDLGSGLIGGLGLAPGANIGDGIAIFEAVHGSAPKYAGLNTINPTAVLFSGVMMLRHIKEFEAANIIEQAVLATLESGVMPQDIAAPGKGVSTTDFTQTIIKNFGKSSNAWKARDYKSLVIPKVDQRPDLVPCSSKKVVGVDIFLDSPLFGEALGSSLTHIAHASAFELKMISNRGVQIYPSAGTSPDVVDLWSCRFMARSGACDQAQVRALVALIEEQHRWVNIELLQTFDSKEAYSKAQGENQSAAPAPQAAAASR